MCINSCNECSRKIYSTSVTVITVNNVDTLVINVPAQSFSNNQRGCIVITQSIPAAATITMPVAISIGGDTATVYPVVSCNCDAVVACQLRTRRRYPFVVRVDAGAGAFKVLRNLSCAPCDNDGVIPATAVTGG